MEGGTETHRARAAINICRRRGTSSSRTSSTLNREVGCGDRVVAGSGGRGPAEVDPAVLGRDVGDDQVSVAQDFGVVHVDGFAVCAAPGDDGGGIPRGHALQHHGLVESGGDVLRTGEDPGPLARFIVRTFARKRRRSNQINPAFLFDENGGRLVPRLTVSAASLLSKRPPTLVATHRYRPPSSGRTLWIWRTPLGRTVILRRSKRQGEPGGRPEAAWMFAAFGSAVRVPFCVRR